MYRYKELNLTQLRVFCEFLRQRSFTDAARTLGVSHSAVWQQVRALERHFQVTLLKRQGRTWRPTEDGDALLDLIGGILHSVDNLGDAFRQLRREQPRTLTIIGSVVAIIGELAGPLAGFRRLQPNCHVRLTVAVSMEQTVEELLTGRADLAVVPQSIAGQMPPRRSLIRNLVGARTPVVAVRVDHPLARKRRLTLADLARVPLLVPTSDLGWRQRMDEAFRQAGLFDRLQVVVETGLPQALRRYAQKGLGVAVFPQSDDDLNYPDLTIRPADHLFPPEEVIYLRQAGEPRPEVQLFEQLLRKERTAAQ